MRLKIKYLIFCLGVFITLGSCASAELPLNVDVEPATPAIFPETPLIKIVSSISKGEGLDKNTYNQVKMLFDASAQDFSSNIVELAHYISILNRKYMWREDRLSAAIGNPCGVNPEFDKYLTDHYHEVKENNVPIPKGLLALVPAENRQIVQNAWNHDSEGNRRLKKMLDTSLSIIRLLIDDDINDIPPYTTIDMNHFHFYEIHVNEFFNSAPPEVLSRFNTKDNEYTVQTIIKFHTTLHYLLSRDTAEETLMLAYLYYQTHIEYRHGPYTRLTMSLLRDQEGDCFDCALFLYTVLKSRGTRPELLIVKREPSIYSHAFVSARLGKRYYIYDNSKLIVHNDFTQGLLHYCGPPKCGRISVSRLDMQKFYIKNQLCIPKENEFVDYRRAADLQPQ